MTPMSALPVVRGDGGDGVSMPDWPDAGSRSCGPREPVTGVRLTGRVTRGRARPSGRSRTGGGSRRPGRARWSRPSRAAPVTGGASTMRTTAAGAAFGQTPGDGVGQQRVPGLEDAAAEHDRDGRGPPVQVEAADRRHRHRRDLLGLAFDQAQGHRVARLGGREQDGRAAGSGRLRRAGPGGRRRPPRAWRAAGRTRGRPRAARSALPGRPRPGSRATWSACPSPRPPPQSPLSAPKARNRVVRPSGATPTQLMPAPQVTAMPQGRSPSPGVRPARSTAKVSLATADVWDQPWRWIAAVSMASSSGRSAPARQADVCRATRPSPAGRSTWRGDGSDDARRAAASPPRGRSPRGWRRVRAPTPAPCRRRRPARRRSCCCRRRSRARPGGAHCGCQSRPDFAPIENANSEIAV